MKKSLATLSEGQRPGYPLKQAFYNDTESSRPTWKRCWSSVPR